MSMKDWEKDINELTVLGKEFFGKTQVLITKIAKEFGQDAMTRLNDFGREFDKTMKILFKHEHKVPTEEKVPIT